MQTDVTEKVTAMYGREKAGWCVAIKMGEKQRGKTMSRKPRVCNTAADKP